MNFTLLQLLKVNSFLGHKSNLTDSRFFSLLLYERSGVHIIDLKFIVFNLRKALFFILNLISRNKNILFFNDNIFNYKVTKFFVKKIDQFFLEGR